MPDFYYFNNEDFIEHGIDNSIISNSYSVQVLVSLQLFITDRARIVSQPENGDNNLIIRFLWQSG